jgi:hypothetical protein
MAFWSLEWVKKFGFDCQAWGDTGIFIVFNAEFADHD